MISLALVSVHTVDENKNSHAEKLDCFRLLIANIVQRISIPFHVELII